MARQNRFDEARAILDEHQERAKQDLEHYARACFIRGTVAKIEGDLQSAHELISKALDLVLTQDLPKLHMSYHRSLRDIARELNDFEGYLNHNEAAQKIEQSLKINEAAKKVALQEQERQIAAERADRERERAVLYSTLPAHIADRVIRGEDVSGDEIHEAAVLFLDIVGFTTLSDTMSPKDVTVLLDRIFTICDESVAIHAVTRIKTIGDSYMAVAFPQPQAPSPSVRATQAALEIIDRMKRQEPNLTVRIGVHCGPVVAGVIGQKHLQYDVWGDTVNMASRMESSGEPGRVQVSSAVASQITDAFGSLTARGPIEIKGKGLVETYWVNG